MTQAFRTDHVVVVGGSIAGLLAARVLADCFDRVTIVERDVLPEGPESRRGVPQDGHLHGLMAAGLATVERLLPGFEAELAAAGAVSGDIAQDVAYALPCGMAPRFVSGVRFRGTTRRLVEGTIRRRVLALGRVTLLESNRVAGLLADGAGAVRGVVARQGGETTEIAADLVVDASGRHSHAPDWLDAIGCGRPSMMVVDSRVAYASQRFARPAGGPDWKTLLIAADPVAFPRYGGIFSEEGGHWAVAVAGLGDDAPPTDDAGFRAYARGLRSPMLHDAIAGAKPVEPVLSYRDTANRVRCYHRMRRLPENFVAVGDAVAALNPVFGQGMTLAAIGAAALGDMLARRGAGPGLARAFQRRLAALNRIPWLLATSQDLRHGSTGPLSSRLIRAYTDRFMLRIPGDRAAAEAFVRALHLVEPTAFLAPGIVARTLLTRRGTKTELFAGAAGAP